MTGKKSVLFLCTHNSARSQMAEGMINTWYGYRFQASSAGISPTTLSPYAVKVMAEVGVDITGQRSKGLAEFRERHFDIVVTVCADASESCPFFPGDKIVHMPFPDPSAFEGAEEDVLRGYRLVRDLIRQWLEELITHW